MTIIKTISFGKEKEGIFLEFKKIAEREGKDLSKLVVQCMEDYVKVHSFGNPSFTIDQFQDPNFQAVPAFLTERQKWIDHYKNSNEKDRTRLRIQATDLQKIFRMVDTNE